MAEINVRRIVFERLRERIERKDEIPKDMLGVLESGMEIGKLERMVELSVLRGIRMLEWIQEKEIRNGRSFSP